MLARQSSSNRQINESNLALQDQPTTPLPEDSSNISLAFDAPANISMTDRIKAKRLNIPVERFVTSRTSFDDGIKISTTTDPITQKSKSIIQNDKVKKTITQDQFILTIKTETQAGIVNETSTTVQRLDLSKYMDRLKKVNKKNQAGREEARKIIDKMTQESTQDPNILNNTDYQIFKESLIEKLNFKSSKDLTSIQKAIQWLKTFFTTISTISIRGTKKTNVQPRRDKEPIRPSTNKKFEQPIASQSQENIPLFAQKPVSENINKNWWE